MKPRFSLRVMLALFVFSAIGFAVWRHTSEARAIARIEAHGGSVSEVTWFGNSPGKRVLINAGWRGGMDELRELDKLTKFEDLWIESTLPDHANLDVSRWPTLCRFELHSGDSSATARVVGLSELTKLEYLLVDMGRLTDTDIGPLDQLTTLIQAEFFDGSGSLNGDFLAHLPPGIQYLRVQSKAIDEENLRHLARYPNLTSLRLTDCLLTDAGFAHLAKIATLESLVVESNSRLSNASEAILLAMPKLNEMHFPRSGLSNAQLRHVAEEMARRREALKRSGS